MARNPRETLTSLRRQVRHPTIADRVVVPVDHRSDVIGEAGDVVLGDVILRGCVRGDSARIVAKVLVRRVRKDRPASIP
jgi:hypothetical protein